VENSGSRDQILTPNKLDLSFHAPNDYAQFHRNWPKIVTVGVTTDTHTYRQTDASDFIICPMLCYSKRQIIITYLKFLTAICLFTMH